MGPAGFEALSKKAEREEDQNGPPHAGMGRPTAPIGRPPPRGRRHGTQLVLRPPRSTQPPWRSEVRPLCCRPLNGMAKEVSVKPNRFLQIVHVDEHSAPT